MGYCWVWGRVQKLFWGLLIEANNFCFLSFALFLLYHVVLSSCGGWVGRWWWWWWLWFPAITLSQSNYSFGCFVVGVVVVVGLRQYLRYQEWVHLT